MNLIPKTTACDLLTVQAVVSHMQCKSYASHQFTNRTLVMIHFVSKLCEASLLSPLTSCSRNDITIRHHMRAKENFYTKFELLWLFVLELCTINPEATQMNTFVNAAQFAFVFCEHWRQTLTLIFDLFTSRVTVAVWSQYDKFEFQI